MNNVSGFPLPHIWANPISKAVGLLCAPDIGQLALSGDIPGNVKVSDKLIIEAPSYTNNVFVAHLRNP